MSFGIYTSVQNGTGGAINCSTIDGASWGNSSSSPQGFTSFTNGATFTANASTGYKFSKFLIYVDTDSETYNDGVQYGTNTNNPLTLPANYVSSGQSYMVRAVFESDGSGSSKEYSITNMGTWATSTTSKNVSIDSYEILRYSYTPTSDGILTFSSSTTGIDTMGWIYNSSSCEVSEVGWPSDWIGNFNDNGNGFTSTAEVTAGTRYYLYVCVYDGDSGSATLKVGFEGVGYSVSNMGVWSTSTTSKSVSIGSYEILRYAYTPTINGTLTFSSSTTGVDTMGWIYTSTLCEVNNTGSPSYTFGSFIDDANGAAFSASANVDAGTTYYLYVCIYNGGSGNTTLNISVRPLNWAWITTVSQGSRINLTASEWNSFTDRINEFRWYAGLSAYNFTTAIAGVTPIDATICNEAYTAIDAIPNHGTLPIKLVLGDLLYASFYNGLKDALNAIS